MVRKLNIYFHAVDMIGRLNSCVGMAQALQARGHHITFLTVPAFKDHYKQFGFDEIILPAAPEILGETDSVRAMSKGLMEIGMISNFTALEKALLYREKFKHSKPFQKKMSDCIAYHETMKKAFVEGKPDVIVTDHVMIHPAIVHSGIPWVRLESANVLILFDDDNLPPFLSGKFNFDLLELQLIPITQFRPFGQRSGQVEGIS